MRKTFSIILLIVITIALSACGRGNTSGEVDLSEPVYEVLIRNSVPPEELVDAFAKYGRQFFIGTHSNIVYTKFFYEGSFDNLEIVDGDMQLTYLATDTRGLLDSSAELIAHYDKSNRHVTYYVLDSSEKPTGTTTPISSARYNEVVEKMKEYFENLGVTSGYIEMTEYALEGYWIVDHLPAKGKKADVELKIDAITLELLEYN